MEVQQDWQIDSNNYTSARELQGVERRENFYEEERAWKVSMVTLDLLETERA